jgi:hypothetical protein
MKTADMLSRDEGVRLFLRQQMLLYKSKVISYVCS